MVTCSMMAEEKNKSKFGNTLNSVRISKATTVIIVTVALLLDNMLLTVIFPIIPEFLQSIEKHEEVSNSIYKNTTETDSSKQNLVRREAIYSLFPIKNLASRMNYMHGNGMNDKVFKPDFTDEWTFINITDTDEIKAYSSEHHPIAETKKKNGSHKTIIQEGVKVGFLLASKAIVQLLANPLIGYLTDKIGYKTPMVGGFMIMFISTIVFAFSFDYFSLLFARAFQGIGSSCASVAGMAVLAQSFPDYNDRGNIMGIALSGGLALGVLIGPTFGGFMYEFVGRSSPFLILASLSFIGLLMQACIIYPDINKTNGKGPSLLTLILDPYILIVTGALMLANMAVAMLQSSLPILMMDRMDVDLWQIGATFLPCSVSYMIGTCLFGRIAARIGRWLTSLLGLYMIGCSFISVIFAHTPEFLIIPMAVTGFGIGMVDSSMLPELGNLVDRRYAATYGGVYAIGDIAVCLGFAIGPALGGGLSKLIGFQWMSVFISILCFIYGPLLIFLRDTNPNPEEHEEVPLVSNNLDQTDVKYDASNQEVSNN